MVRIIFAVLAIVGAVFALAAQGSCALSFPSSIAAFLAADGQASGRRIYLFPGLDANVSADFSAGPLLDFVNGLRATGNEVVLLPLPAPQACFFTAGGARYRDGFAAALNKMLNDVEASHGPAKNIAAGISYGGLHSLMSVVLTNRFSAWLAHVPVVRLDALAEFPAVGDVKDFNPQFEVPMLRMRGSGLIAWGTQDTRVNGALAKLLAQQLPDSIRKIEYAGQDHSTTDQNVKDLLAWVNAQ